MGPSPMVMACDGAAVVIDPQAGRGGDGAAAVDDVILQPVGGGHLMGRLSHQRLQIPVVDLLFCGEGAGTDSKSAPYPHR